jgi:hypothetical protein
MLYTEQNLAAALALSRAGIPIFPALILKRNTGWMKKPAIENWQERASTDETQIRRWFAKFPQAVPGIELGRAGLLVLDPDRHGPTSPDGIEAFAELAIEIGGLPEHPQGSTPQGFHHFWKQPDGIMLGNGSGGLPKGIDVRGQGGWVVAPGAVRADGQTYTPRAGTPSLAEAFKAGTIPPLPDAIVQLIVGEHCNGPRDTDAGQPAADFPLPVDVEAELAAMRPGNVNATHCKVIGSMLSAGLPYEEIVAHVVNRTMQMAVMLDLKDWTQANEFKFVRSCMVGLLKARCQQEENPSPAPIWVAPELADGWEALAQKGGRPHIVWRTGSGWYVRNNWVWDREKRGATTADANQTDQSNEQTTGGGSSSTDEQTATGGSSSHNEQARQQSRQPPPRIHPKPFSCFDFTQIPQREWLYGHHYMRGIASATISPGGGGKTTLGLVEAVSMATVRNLLGEQPTERLHVWYHNGEDGTDELNRRIAAVCVRYNIDPHELDGWLFVTSGLEMPIKIAGGNGDVRLNKQVSDAVIMGIQDNSIDVLVMDPLITLHSLAEAENHKMDPVLRKFASIANEMNCCIELAHHTRKKVTGQEEYTTADARGASAIIDAVRSARTINSLNDRDAKLLGVEDEIERLSYFRLDRGKANMTRRGAAAYFRFVGVELPNGRDGSAGDDVGTVECIMPPDVSIELTPTDIAFLVAETANSDQAEKPQAANWFGNTIAKHFNLNPDAGTDRIKIEGVIRDLFQRKAIRCEMRRSRNPKDRHQRKFYIPR